MFKIEISERESYLKRDIEDSSISEALETIYQGNANFDIIWNKITIHVSLDSDMCMIIFDIKRMFKELKKNKTEGTFTISWGSPSFFTQWDFEVKEKILIIDSYWTTVNGNMNSLRKPNNKKIIVDKDYFLEEWRKVLSVIKEDLLKAGYNETNIEDFQFLINNTSPMSEVC